MVGQQPLELFILVRIQASQHRFIMGSKIRIQKAEAEDARAVYEIFSSTRSQMLYLPPIHTSYETEQYITSLVEAGKIFVIRKNNVIAGFMQIEDGLLNHLYVHPKFQGEGLGKILLDRAKEISPNGIVLWVFEENTEAIKFYEREGFTLIEKRGKKEAKNEENLPDRKYEWKKVN